MTSPRPGTPITFKREALVSEKQQDTKCGAVAANSYPPITCQLPKGHPPTGHRGGHDLRVWFLHDARPESERDE